MKKTAKTRRDNCRTGDFKINTKHHAVFFAILGHGHFSPTIDTAQTMDMLGMVNNKVYRNTFSELEEFGLIAIVSEVKYSSITVTITNNSHEQD